MARYVTRFYDAAGTVQDVWKGDSRPDPGDLAYYCQMHGFTCWQCTQYVSA